MGVTRWSCCRAALTWLAAWRARRRRETQRRRVRTAAPPAAPLPARARTGASLRALTAAALALPGLAAHAAEGDGWSFQYGRFSEGERAGGAHSAFDPIRVDSLSLDGRITLLDRWKLDLSYGQDTWSGATPIASAPGAVRGNRSGAPDGVSSATPYLQNDLFLDDARRPLRTNALGGFDRSDGRLVHTLSSASPETRNQGGLKLGYEWDDAALELGAAVSHEPDYESRSWSATTRWDLAQKLTTLSLGLSYGTGRTRAELDHDAVPYIDTKAFSGQIGTDPRSGKTLLRGNRRDWGAELGLTQVVSRGGLLEASAGLARSGGYLENPYKAVEVGFIDPEQQFQAPPGGSFAQLHALLEQRPDVRTQWTAGLRYVQSLDALGASLHLGYQFYRDSWGIAAHTLEASWAQPLADGWTLTPRVRFYSQNAADFYTPYLLSDQAFETIVSDPDTGRILSRTPFDRALLPAQFSSDERLAGYGSISAGATLARQLSRGVSLELDFEYYRRAGKLKLGGQRELDPDDLHSYLLSAAFHLNSAALQGGGRSHGGGPVIHHHEHSGPPAPAGVMLDHMLEQGGAMVSARYSFSGQGGDLLHGASAASDGAILADGCAALRCRTAPERMDMRMRMFDLMYAPSDWLNWMLMAQFMDMDMDLQPLRGGAPDPHADHGHSTGGVGDTQAFALIRLLELPGHHMHFSVGLSAPTGAVGLEFRRTHQEDGGLTHYGMQLGSGTWDLLPSLTYTGEADRWSWGAQLGATRRLQPRNRSGYALGDAWQGTAWASYRLTRWLAVSGRLAYSAQGPLRGAYDQLHSESGPMDFPGNYGGRFWDAGLGLSVAGPAGALEGNRLSIEWLLPLRDDVRGFQLERSGSFFGTWSVIF